MDDEYITAKRELGNGRWDRKLKENMTNLSTSDNYDDAKHEWIATGEVWWQGIGTPRPDWALNHPNQCIVNSLVTMWMIFTNYISYNSCRFSKLFRPIKTTLIHCI